MKVGKNRPVDTLQPILRPVAVCVVLTEVMIAGSVPSVRAGALGAME